MKSAGKSTKDLFKEYLAVCNLALENAKTKPFLNQYLRWGEPVFNGSFWRFILVDDQDQEIEAYTVQLKDGRCVLHDHAEVAKWKTYKMPLEYIQDVIANQATYIEHPYRLDTSWLKHRSRPFLSKLLPPSTKRVEHATPHRINRKIYADTRSRINYYRHRPELIDSRIQELEREWDIERIMEFVGPTAILAGILLSRRYHKGWLIYSGAVSGFLAIHALQGWAPPLPLLRKLGFRTETEIHQEMMSLKILRGDFERVLSTRWKKTPNSGAILKAVKL